MTIIAGLDADDGDIGVLQMERAMISAFKLAGAIAVVIGLKVYAALVLSFLWQWFVADSFGVRAIDIIHAIGLILITSLILQGRAYQSTIAQIECDIKRLENPLRRPPSEVARFVSVAGTSFCSSTVLLAAGWAIKHLM